MNWLDRFAAKHPRLGVPNLMLYIVAGNLIVYFFDLFSGGAFSQILDFRVVNILLGEVWRLVTFIFVPMYSGIGNAVFFALSLYFYYFIGSVLEREWGATKFTLFYFAGVLFNILVGFVAGTATMHYVNLSMFFAFATLYPDLQVLLFFIIPIKVKWLALLDVALFLYDIIRLVVLGAWLWALLPVVAILNYLLFFVPDLRRSFFRVKRRTSPQVINFKAAQKKAKETKGYMHKCAVCGVTDTDDPQMEFRYCSKCDGYFCYCMNHINNHTHVKKD